MSSSKLPDSGMPIVCERCGSLVATPAYAAQADDSAERAGRCPACGHGWFVPLPSGQIIVRRKPDRRATPRGE
ncbi:MAG TPA: hypothetical protein VM096_19490 [Vicinamibacterales bacterium]|nr:hypothetical protein [Vicinamibacterales bacterium]